MSAALPVDSRLKFGRGNAKLTDGTITFTLPAGFTCPHAKACKAFVREKSSGEKYIDDCQQPTSFQEPVRCFAACSEARYAAVYQSVRHNLELLRQCREVSDFSNLISGSLPAAYDCVRIHVGGDFFSETYLLGWNEVAKANPDRLFYAYTKSLPFWVANLDKISANFVLTASYGGSHDELIERHGLKNVKIYFHPEDARADHVLIDHDDSLAKDPAIKRFGLLLHGVQPKESRASAAIRRMNKEHIQYSYNGK